MIAAELESLLRRLVREELERLISGDDSPVADDAALRERVARDAAKLRKARGGSR